MVTGGAGFLGSHLCEYLLDRDWRVICLDNLDTGSLENIEQLRGERFDFRYHNCVEYISVEEPVDVVFHLASPASPVDYLRLPLRDAQGRVLRHATMRSAWPSSSAPGS